MEAAAYIDLARRYLAASEERRLDDARVFLAEGVTFVFPAGHYDSLEALVAAAGGRYRRIEKRHGDWDVAAKGNGVVVVSTGTLTGENVHGVPFDGVRYIDRIVLRGRKIVRHEVWNDLCESGALDRRPA